MIKRTTIELDLELLARTKDALGKQTTRATVEEALLRAAESAEGAIAERVASQRVYLDRLDKLADLNVLRSGEMWR